MTVEILSTAENFTKHCTQKGLQHTNQINSHLRASEMALFDKLLLLLARCKKPLCVALFPMYYHLRDCL